MQDIGMWAICDASNVDEEQTSLIKFVGDCFAKRESADRLKVALQWRSLAEVRTPRFRVTNQDARHEDF